MLTLDHFAADSLAQVHYFSSECQALALYYKRMGFFVFYMLCHDNAMIITTHWQLHIQIIFFDLDLLQSYLSLRFSLLLNLISLLLVKYNTAFYNAVFL